MVGLLFFYAGLPESALCENIFFCDGGEMRTYISSKISEAKRLMTDMLADEVLLLQVEAAAQRASNACAPRAKSCLLVTAAVLPMRSTLQGSL